MDELKAWIAPVLIYLMIIATVAIGTILLPDFSMQTIQKEIK